MTLRWRWRVLQVELGARGDLEPSGAVAGLGGRHAWRFWAAVMVTLSSALACGGARGACPGSKDLMMIMGPPRDGQG